MGPVDFFRNGSNVYASYGVMLEDFRGMVRNAGPLGFLKEEAGVRCLSTMLRFVNEPSHNPRRDTLRKLAIALHQRRRYLPTPVVMAPKPLAVASKVCITRTRDKRKLEAAETPRWQQRAVTRRLARRTA